MKFKLIWSFVFCASVFAKAQSSSEIYHQLKKFNSFNSALYLAAHPDDENTRVIAWLENGEKARTAYLSLTRGDGGQNLIGNELGAELGIVRTQELLAARRIDGGEQFFTRAVDFGYSKSADESFEKWTKEKILYDAVWVIRKFQPDVIITRFPPDKRGGHGHHTASAIIAIEAFEKAADPNVFPEQLQYLQTWQAQAVYWNSSVWWNKNLDSLARNNDDYLVAQIGDYDELLGMNYNELGTLARSQHKSQGFGVRIERGERLEYFQWLAGDKLQDNFFEKINRSWASLGGDETLEGLVKDLEANFNFKMPEESVPTLISIQQILLKLSPSVWRNAKLHECEKLIMMCAGLHIEALANDYTFNANQETEISVEILNRSDAKVLLENTHFSGVDISYNHPGEALEKNKIFKKEYNIVTPDKKWNPYWLNKPYQNVFEVEDIIQIGKPQNDPMLGAELILSWNGVNFSVRVPVEYKWSDRVHGELKRPVINTPNISATFSDQSYVFTAGEVKEIAVNFKNYGEPREIEMVINAPKGWLVMPGVQTAKFENKYEEKAVTFLVTAPKKETVGNFKVTIDGVKANSISEVTYDHFPTQLLFYPAKAKTISLDIDIEPGVVGYIAGAGDKVPEAIMQMGYKVVMLTKEDLSTGDIYDYQAIVTGIRAYNVHPWLFDFHDLFMQYVREGGNFIVQYNTRSRSKSFDASKIGPYPFVISRDRVSEENAEVSFIDPTHRLLKEPNKITKDDFDDWVQERGLYFANDLDSQYQTLFSWHDKEESPKLGGLIYAPYHNGCFIYTGISFFRQLPAGVPGAFKLFANMISHESDE